MTFYKKFTQLIKSCEQYHDLVDDNELWFDEPYQAKYLSINEFLIFAEENKAAIESISAVGLKMKTGDHVDLIQSRQEYYDLEKVVPPFLAGGQLYYYYLQTYYIACLKLIKDFSYSLYPPDFAKMRQVKEWFYHIKKSQTQHDSKSSFRNSIEKLQQLGNFDQLSEEELQQLEAEVHNLQTLLSTDDALQEEMSPEEAELYRSASEFLALNSVVFDELPPLEDDFEFEEGPFIETATYRCQQLLVQVDHFPDDYKKIPKVTHLYEFKQELKNYFDMSITTCADIYLTIVQLIGSNKNLTLIKLCKIIHRAIEPFTEEKFMQKRYAGFDDGYNALDAELGLPDTVQIFDLLCLSIGEITAEDLI
jgi:hypothetical protein